MSYIGMPYDNTFYSGTRIEGYTNYSDLNPSIWVSIANDIEAQTGSVNGKRVLEMGCAFGYLTNELASRGAIITGIDISTYAINRGNSLFPTRDLVVMDATVTTFSPKTFELVIALGIVECMPNLQVIRSLLTETKRILKASGKVYILENLSSGALYTYLSKNDWQSNMQTTWAGKTITVTDVSNILPFDVRITAV